MGSDFLRDGGDGQRGLDLVAYQALRPRDPIGRSGRIGSRKALDNLCYPENVRVRRLFLLDERVECLRGKEAASFEVGGDR